VTPKKVVSKLKQVMAAVPGKTPVELPKIPAPDPRAALLPAGFIAEVVLSDLTYPSSVEFDDSGNLFVAEAGYNYGDDAAPARVWRVTSEGARQVVADHLNGPSPTCSGTAAGSIFRIAARSTSARVR